MRAISVLLLCAFAAPAANTLYNIETLAGTTFTGDGKPATSAVLVQPSGITVDPAGNVYIADAGDHRIRRVGVNGIIQTVAGTGSPGQRGDGGPAVQAQLNSPYGITLDSAGNLFIADLGNGCIRKLSTDGSLSTVAGGGRERPAPGTPVRATQAKLTQPRDVAVDRAGNLFIADFGAHMVYQVTSDGTLIVLAGTGEAGTSTQGVPAMTAMLSWPAALAIDAAGTLHVADSGNRRIRRILMGFLFTVCDKTGKEVELGTPTGLAFDTLGRLYIADGAPRTTVVTATGELMSIGIGGTSVATGRGAEVYTASERQVLRLNGAAGEPFAGMRGGPGAGDGSNRNEWRFTSPSALVQDSFGSVYIADTGNGRVRRLSPQGELTTVSAKFPAPVSLAFDSRGRLHIGDRLLGIVYTLDAAGQTRIIAQSDTLPMNPAAIAFDQSDNLLIADAASHLIRKVTPAGTMTILAGNGNQTDDGQALLAKLNTPAGIAVDSQGDVWFTESLSGRIRRLSGGRVTTLTGPELKEPRGIRIEVTGDIVVADRGSHRVFRVSPSGEWTPLAGSGDSGHAGDGSFALAATLSGPTDVVPCPDGTLLIADTGNNRIRRISPTENRPETPAGPPPEPVLAGLEVLHAATLRAQSVAPGQIVIVRGAVFQANSQVTVAGAAASILDWAEDHLTVQLPATLRDGDIDLSVSSGASVSGRVSITVGQQAPGIVTAAGGTGQALAINQTGETNGSAYPAARGSVVTLYLTGEGTRPDSVTALIGGYESDVMWAGPAPGWPGLFQVNLRTPGGFSPSGIVQVIVTVNGVRSQAGVTIVSR